MASATQMFVEDPSVLFVSSHQSGSYPGTGRLTEVGKGDGEGATINLPLPGASALWRACAHLQPSDAQCKSLSSCSQPFTDPFPCHTRCTVALVPTAQLQSAKLAH